MDGRAWNRQVRGAEAFRHAYDTTPPWDTGRPQPAILEAADAGLIRGRVLDVGCGTGEHALLAASLGLDATGVDVVPAAVAIAERKAAERDLHARFVVADVLDTGDLLGTNDTVIDVGLFHVLDDHDRTRYLQVLRRAVTSGGHVLLLCFSDRVPGDAGPRRVTADEIRASFSAGWRIDALDESSIEVAHGPVAAVHAWRATIVRT